MSWSIARDRDSRCSHSKIININILDIDEDKVSIGNIFVILNFVFVVHSVIKTGDACVNFVMCAVLFKNLHVDLLSVFHSTMSYIIL